jgi:tetratricopeptide (TPR) repeat protein
MRGQWAAAADQCAEVLRRDPANPTAHSLLGDIYQDQGRPEEARHWYQIALELNPGSEADRAKLSRAEEMLEARQQRAEWAAVIEGRSQPVATKLLVRESIQRVAAVAGALLCAIVLVMATLVSVTDRGATAAQDGSDVPILQRRAPHRTALAAGTRREKELLRRLIETSPGGMAQVLRVDLDLRTHTGSVRLFFGPKTRDGVNTSQFRFRVMREAYRAARALYSVDHSLRQVNVHALGPSNYGGPTGEPEILFTGNVQVEDLVVEPGVVTAEELQRFFGRGEPPLWAPDLSTV